jgi:hypothetical protein
MLLHKVISPEEVLTIVAKYFHRGLPEELKDDNITVTFVDDKGTVEICISEEKPQLN